MDVKERIQNYLDDKGIKTTTFEKEVGMSNGYWRKTKSISANILTDILKKYTDLSIDYILGKSEEMFCCPPENPSLYHRSSSASVVGVSTDLQRTHNGGTTDLRDERIKLLEEKLAFREEQLDVKDATIAELQRKLAELSEGK